MIGKTGYFAAVPEALRRALFCIRCWKLARLMGSSLIAILLPCFIASAYAPLMKIIANYFRNLSNFNLNRIWRLPNAYFLVTSLRHLYAGFLSR